MSGPDQAQVKMIKGRLVYRCVDCNRLVFQATQSDMETMRTHGYNPFGELYDQPEKHKGHKLEFVRA